LVSAFRVEAEGGAELFPVLGGNYRKLKGLN
jgi:hypothetical protein